MNFGISVVVNGQKSSVVNARPTLSVKSTLGKFEITSPVSKKLGIAPGENVMFLNNFGGITDAIATQNPELVQYAEENGIDLTTREGQDAILATFGKWYIAKGVAKFSKNGTPATTVVRETKEAKQARLEANKVEYAKAMHDVLAAQYGDLSDEELAEYITVDIMPSIEVQDFTGSKTATTSNATGVGCQLNFTDSNIWNTLKEDLEDKGSVNRVFDVDLEASEVYEISNGFENVPVVVYPISNPTDVAPMVREKKDAESAE